MDPLLTDRVQWWLRAERAFGLRSAVMRNALSTPAEVQEPAALSHFEAGRVAADQGVVAEPAPRRRVEGPPQPGGASLPATGGSLFVGEAPLAMPAADAPAFATQPLSTEEKRRRLAAMDADEVRGCTRCRLCETRTHTVFGEGDPNAQIFIIGEGPGENEDLTGRPFVGKAGELLNKWIAAMGLAREQVFIANIVKCRPPANRVPAPDEVATCTPYLQRQLETIRPRVIITLGLPSSRYMLQSNLSMGKLRGQWHTWRGIKLMPTYHPAYILRSYTYDNRAAVWSDLQQVMGELGLPVKSPGGAASAGGS